MLCSPYICAALFIFLLMITTSYNITVRRFGFSHTQYRGRAGEAANRLERAAEGLENLISIEILRFNTDTLLQAAHRTTDYMYIDTGEENSSLYRAATAGLEAKL